MAENSSRATALAQLKALGAGGAVAEGPAEAKVTATGTEVYAGGDVARVLTGKVHLSYTDGKGVRHYPEAKVGDTVLLTEAQAKRYDALGVTAVDVDEAEGDEPKTDEELAAMGAEDLVAHVGQHPEDRDRVRALEEQRGDKARKTVLAATEPVTE